jgi:hypothetical protein
MGLGALVICGLRMAVERRRWRLAKVEFFRVKHGCLYQVTSRISGQIRMSLYLLVNNDVTVKGFISFAAQKCRGMGRKTGGRESDETVQ